MEASRLLQIVNDGLSYNPDTGLFTHTKNKQGGKKKGDIAGSYNKVLGYVVIKLKGKSYMAHRLAWLVTYGTFPKGQIDHINHNRSDNKISNLRDVSVVENQRNITKPSDNTSGVVGVRWNEKANRWHARIAVDGKEVYLGYHVEFSDAVNARKNAEVLYGFHENHGRDKGDYNE